VTATCAAVTSRDEALARSRRRCARAIVAFRILRGATRGAQHELMGDRASDDSTVPSPTDVTRRSGTRPRLPSENDDEITRPDIKALVRRQPVVEEQVPTRKDPRSE
jgi:hypothetical protein